MDDPLLQQSPKARGTITFMGAGPSAFREERLRLRSGRGEILVRVSSVVPAASGTSGDNVTADDVNLTFDDRDNSRRSTDECITIFYHHGSMASMDMYNDIIDQFKGRCNIIAYDALGCGKSDKPLGPFELYSSSNMFEDFCEVFLKYATKRVILVGHSFGTTQVARMCHRIKNAGNSMYSGDFKGYTVLATILLGTAYTVPDGGNPIFKLPVFILNCFRQKMSDAFMEKGLSPRCDLAVRQLCIQNSGKNNMNIVKAFYQQFRWGTLEEWSSLKAIDTLVVHGLDDKILLPENAERLVSFLREGREEGGIALLTYETLVDCAHQIMMEKPVELKSILANFLKKYI